MQYAGLENGTLPTIYQEWNGWLIDTDIRSRMLVRFIPLNTIRKVERERTMYYLMQRQRL